MLRGGSVLLRETVDLHVLATSALRVAIVECFFREPKERRIRHLALSSVVRLIAATTHDSDHRAVKHRVFAWTATIQRIPINAGRAITALAMRFASRLVFCGIFLLHSPCA